MRERTFECVGVWPDLKVELLFVWFSPQGQPFLIERPANMDLTTIRYPNGEHWVFLTGAQVLAGAHDLAWRDDVDPILKTRSARGLSPFLLEHADHWTTLRDLALGIDPEAEIDEPNV